MKVTLISSNSNGAARAPKSWHTSLKFGNVFRSTRDRNALRHSGSAQNRLKNRSFESTTLQTELFVRAAEKSCQQLIRPLRLRRNYSAECAYVADDLRKKDAYIFRLSRAMNNCWYQSRRTTTSSPTSDRPTLRILSGARTDVVMCNSFHLS